MKIILDNREIVWYNICIGDIMIRKQIYITNKQDEVFKKFASDDGTSASELMRRALDEYIDKKYLACLMANKPNPLPLYDDTTAPADVPLNCVPRF